MSCSKDAKKGAEDELTRLALAELAQEAERGKQRSSTMGVTGWMKPKMQPNKRFLKNTLLAASKQRDFKRAAPAHAEERRKSRKSGLTSCSIQHKRPSSQLQEDVAGSRKVKKQLSEEEYLDSVKGGKRAIQDALPKR